MPKSFWEQLDEHAENNESSPSRDFWLWTLGIVFCMGLVGWLLFYLFATQ